MKITPKLKDLLIQFSPQDTGEPLDDCWVIVRASIGEPDSKGADQFLFYITTPKKLAATILGNDYRFGKSLLIVEKYDENLVKKAIEKLLEHINGDTWKEVAWKINRYSQWEFEDYQEYEGSNNKGKLKNLFNKK